jgi:PPK2 family polyphosphate:nucleotide phosphotransferase
MSLSARTENEPFSAQAAPSSHRIEPGQRVVLAEIDPNQQGDFEDKEAGKEALKRQRERIQALQERLYAEGKQSLLVVLQATDTGGKDGTISHVFGGVNPQGCRVWPFKQPTEEELAHDFLWRIHKKAPRRGMITVFNRSHYEDVLVARVKRLVPEHVWRARYDHINHWEWLLAQNGTSILKFFLHISKEEQKERLQARLDDPAKHWKFNTGDLKDRALWDDYQAAFEEAISHCSTEYAPWYVIPANRKWYRNAVIARIVADTLEAMNPQYPPAEEGLDTITIPD